MPVTSKLSVETPPVIRFREVSRHFIGAAGRVRALDGFSAAVCGNEWLFLIGPNGCGKSTLLRVIAGDAVPDGGEVVWSQGHSKSALMHIEQRTDDNLVPSMTIYENLVLAARSRHSGNSWVPGLRRYTNSALRRQAASIFEQFGTGLEKRLDMQVRGLSGGERQLVVVAKVRLQNPAILLLDEFTSSLDSRSAEIVVAGIAEWRRESAATVIAATHDYLAVEQAADRILVMNQGRLVDELHRGSDDLSLENLVRRVHERTR